jgi:hypothetical protein
MADPHNPERYGELWPQFKINLYLQELEEIKPYVVFSGGWAWHFMSPEGHAELKHAHDHKDADIFVLPQNVPTVISLLKYRGFERVSTQYDNLPNNNDFRRYEKVTGKESEYDEGSINTFRITIDFFVQKDLQIREINGWNVVDPKQLLTFYSNIHTSDNCFAVKAAQDLLNKGIDPIGREELVKIPVK